MMPSESTKGRAASDCGAASAEQVRHSPILEGWLRIATRGLCEAAVKRIQSEVSAHYREAVEAYRSQGMPEEEAQRRAGECLGDPDAARRGFHRTYPVKWQEWVLSEMTSVGDSQIGLAFGFFVVYTFLHISGAHLTQSVIRELKSVLGPRAGMTAMMLMLLIPCLPLWLPYWISVWRADRKGAPRPASMAAWHFERWPKATAVFALMLCVPRFLAETTHGWPFQAEYIWIVALPGAWKVLWDTRWRRELLRDLLAVVLGGVLAWGSFAVFQHALDKAANPFIRHGISLEVNPLYPGNAVFWAFIASLLLGASLLTFLGAWLARKRGNGPSQATPEPVRDDAI